MAHRRLRLAPVTLLLFLAACTAAKAPSLTSEAPSFAADADERQLLQRARVLDELLRDKGLLFQDEAVESYVRRVGDRLVPAAAARHVSFQFRVLRDPLINAFALPNGSIYLNVGLLARLENEAQLAHVLAHEIAHVVRRHGLDRLRARRSTMMIANIADVALFGTSIAYLPAMGVLAGHSRENETEADRMGLEYASAAGYSLAEVTRLFEVIQEVAQRESIWGSVYSSHPDNQQRTLQAREVIESAKLASNAGARSGVQEYLAVRHSVIVENIRLKLNIRHYQLAAKSAEAALAHAPQSAWLHYYRGEAYRLMAEDPEGSAREQAWISGSAPNKELVAEFRGRKRTLLASAKQSFQESLAFEAQFAEAYRGLGLVAFAEGDVMAARVALRQYLAKGKDIKDRRYIDHVLGRIDKP
jgi:beta-barrel assembly-enhancing protease